MAGAAGFRWAPRQEPRLSDRRAGKDTCALAVNQSLHMVVARELSDCWSSQQISGWLIAQQLPANESASRPQTVAATWFYKCDL